MNNKRESMAAIYARVSSENQAQAQTIASQLAALRERVQADGWTLLPETEFIDNGYRGATLLRPALERLRDLAASGGVERVYVHSPDRLARKYAWQVLLIDEFARVGVEVVFLNRELGRSPEDDLLLQVQGMVAEYERAKILERSRRGKRHKAQTGRVSVLSGAPYGYRYVSQHDGGGEARYEIEPEEAAVVRQIFGWIGRDRLTINEVCRRLTQQKVPTRKGKASWNHSSVWGMLKNPAYTGQAVYGRTQSVPYEPQLLRPQRGGSWPPREPVTRRVRPREEWVKIPVPAIISEELVAAVQEQLRENLKRERARRRGARFLLQGLVCCARCGYAWYGIVCGRGGSRPEGYEYYRCTGSDGYRFGGQQLCQVPGVRTEALDALVWEQVRSLLEQPERLAEEYQRRSQSPSEAQAVERPQLERQLNRIRQGIARLIDSYAAGYLEKSEFEPRITGLKQRAINLEKSLQQLSDKAEEQRQLRLIIGHLEEFSQRISAGLGHLDWAGRRTLIRTLVKRVEMNEGQVKVVFRVDGVKPGSAKGGGIILQDQLNSAG